MKKILSLLATLSFVTSTVTAVFSCKTPESADLTIDEDSTIGTQFDTRNAKDTSSDKANHQGFSNFFTIGDSLSDKGGIQTLAKDVFDVDLKLTGEYVGGFSNGSTVATLINEELNFTEEEYSSSNLVHDADITLNSETVWGKNYSVGGATAYEVGGLMALLMGNAGIYKQAQALVQQQVINEDDLFFVEIGGNDMFAILDDIENTTNRAAVMASALENIKNALYTLLNNGAKQIVFLTPPNMNFVPKYRSSSDKETISLIGTDFNTKINAIIDAANAKYDNAILNFDLFARFESILDGFQALNSENVVTEGLCYSREPDFTNINNLELNATIYPNNEGKEDNFFFVDYVHPTRAGHKYVFDLVFNDIQTKWINA